MSRLTASDVEAFCDNMKAALLKCLEGGTPVHLHSKPDVDVSMPFTGKGGY